MSVNTLGDSAAASSKASTAPAATISEITPVARSSSEQSVTVHFGAPTPIPLQNPSPASAMAVQDSDIAQLAAAVNLGSASAGVSKDVWARETPVAQKLLNGLCDCDQRNWLNHFVETGNEALSGSENYDKSVQVLATLRRSNIDLVNNQNFH
jgi:hypothetical protein